MSSRQRKRPGGAVDSGSAHKRSRLLPSSADGTSQAEQRDLEEDGTLAFEPEVIDLTRAEVITLTGGSSKPEVVTISDDESAVDREQSQQQPILSGASENSAEPFARDAEEEPREDDGAQPAGPASSVVREGGDLEVQDREQSQQYPLGSGVAEISAELWASDHEEEPRDYNGSIDSDDWPDRCESPWTWQDDITDDWEGSQQYSVGSRSAEDSLQRVPSNLLQEPRDIEFSIDSDDWPGPFERLWTWQDDITDDWEGSQQYSVGSRSAEDSLQRVPSNLLQEPRDIEFEPQGDLVSPPNCLDDNAEFLEVYEWRRRNANLNTGEQVDGSGNGTGANDAPVAGPAPAEQRAPEEGAAHSEDVPARACPGVVIRCPICMDFYSEIVQSGRHLVATFCGHVFCSKCLPVVIETAGQCPTCRMELTPILYHTLYL